MTYKLLGPPQPIILLRARDIPGIRLRTIRNDLKISQVELARLMTAQLGQNWSKTTVSKVENLNRRLNFDEMAAAAIVTGCSLIVFFIPPEWLTLDRLEARSKSDDVFPVFVYFEGARWYGAREYVETVLQLSDDHWQGFLRPRGGVLLDQVSFRASVDRRFRTWLEGQDLDRLAEYSVDEVLVRFDDGAQVRHVGSGLLIVDYGPRAGPQEEQI